MKLRKLILIIAVPLIGLLLGACSKEAAEDSAATAGDTAVHTAEVAVATADELMTKGQGVYNANCAACHQPNGQGLEYPDSSGERVVHGVAPNELTASEDRDWLAGTPWHKHVRARVEAVA